MVPSPKGRNVNLGEGMGPPSVKPQRGTQHHGKKNDPNEEFPGMDKVAAGRQATTPQVERLLKEQEKFKARSDVERRRLQELEKQAEVLEAKLNQRRQKLGGVNAPRDSAQQVRKQITILENRLEKALAKHNGTLAHNRKLRENIDNFRRERLVFNQLYKKLEKDLVDRKKEMQHIIEVSNRAYEAREAAVTEMARLKSQSDREHQVFESEFKELGRLIEHDRKMRDYMRMKSKEEQEGMHSAEEEADLRRSKKGLNGTQPKSTKSMVVTTHVNSDAVSQSYSEAFSKIQRSSGISEFDELMTTFAAAEDENYRLYKYIDQLTQDISRLEEQIGDIKVEIDRYRVVDEKKAVGHEATLQEVKERFKQTEDVSHKYDKKQEAVNTMIETLKGGIWNAFIKLGCNTDVNMAIVGSDGITTRNMLKCMSMLEVRSTEILQAYTARQEPEATTGDEPKELMTGQVVTIEPPSTTDKNAASDDEEEEEEEEDRPLTRAELQVKTLKSLQKREGAVAKKKQMKLDAASIKQEAATGATTPAHK